MHNQKYKTLLNNTFLLGLGTFGSKLLTFLMVRFYTGVLSPSDYGTADLIMQTANLLIPIASLALPMASSASPWTGSLSEKPSLPAG